MMNSRSVSVTEKVTIPASPTRRKERRREVRFNIYFPIMLRAAGDGGVWCRGYTVNLSRSGAFILSQFPWELTKEIDVFIKGPVAGRPAIITALARARVVRIEDPGATLRGNGTSFALGISFITEEDRVRVEALIESCIITDRYGPGAA